METGLSASEIKKATLSQDGKGGRVKGEVGERWLRSAVRVVGKDEGFGDGGGDRSEKAKDEREG